MKTKNHNEILEEMKVVFNKSEIRYMIENKMLSIENKTRKDIEKEVNTKTKKLKFTNDVERQDEIRKRLKSNEEYKNLKFFKLWFNDIMILIGGE